MPCVAQRRKNKGVIFLESFKSFEEFKSVFLGNTKSLTVSNQERLFFLFIHVFNSFYYNSEGLEFYLNSEKIEIKFSKPEELLLRNKSLTLNLNTWLKKADKKDQAYVEISYGKEIKDAILNKVKMETKRKEKKAKRKEYLFKKLCKNSDWENSRIGDYGGQSFLIIEGGYDVLEEFMKICKVKTDYELMDFLNISDYGFSDEYSTCSRCGKIVHEYNTSFIESLVVGGCELICSECFEVGDLEDFINNHKKSVPNFFFENIKEELTKDGWYKHKETSYQMGDKFDPIPEEMLKISKGENIFVTTGFNMFGCDFEMWTKDEEEEEEDELLCE